MSDSLSLVLPTSVDAEGPNMLCCLSSSTRSTGSIKTSEHWESPHPGQKAISPVATMPSISLSMSLYSGKAFFLPGLCLEMCLSIKISACHRMEVQKYPDRNISLPYICCCHYYLASIIPTKSWLLMQFFAWPNSAFNCKRYQWVRLVHQQCLIFYYGLHTANEPSQWQLSLEHHQIATRCLPELGLQLCMQPVSSTLHSPVRSDQIWADSE